MSFKKETVALSKQRWSYQQSILDGSDGMAAGFDD
jgi:hypothetical protein